jgi:hypothetical protein
LVFAGVTLILAPLSPLIHPGLRYRLMVILVIGLALYAIWEFSFEIMRYCICTFESQSLHNPLLCRHNNAVSMVTEPDAEKRNRDRIHSVKIVWFFTFMIFSFVLTIFAAVYIGLA